MSIVKNLKNTEISIEKAEVLRYLRYKGQEIESSFSEKIDLAIEQTRSIITPRAVYERYPLKFFEDRIEVEGTNLVLKSKDISKLLRGCDECILFAATIGTKVEMETRKAEYVDLAKSIIMDSAATTFVERTCDYVQEIIEKEVEKSGKYITMRYSPGYGDLPLECGKEILNILQSQKKIGLTTSSSGLMIPRKSVSAIIGIYDSSKDDDIDKYNKVKKGKKSCLECPNYNNCIYRRESGGACYGN